MEATEVPKMKTHRGLAKRVKRTASGKLKRKQANHRHMLVSKGRKRKRHLGASTLIADVEEKRLNALLNF
jgi:large subunit ribosomal protein L35